jgi:hypothetical protein
MIQTSQRMCFPPEPSNRVRVTHELVRQELERDAPREPIVLGVVDHPHAAYPKAAGDPVV